MLIQWLTQTLAMAITAFILPGLRITSLFGAFGIVVALGFVNASLWDASLFFNMPTDFSTHGIRVLVANALIFWVLVKLLPGIEIKGIVSAIAAPIIFTVCTMVLTPICREIDWGKVSLEAADTVRGVRDSLQQERESLLKKKKPTSELPAAGE